MFLLQFNISLFECLLCLFILSFLFIFYPLVLFFSLSVFFFSLFSPFHFLKFSCSWVVSSFSLSITFLHNFLNLCKLLLSFLFLFCHQKNTILSVYFGCWTCFTFFLVLSCFQCLEQWFLQFSHFLLACCDVSEKMLFFIQQIGEDIFCFFSFCHVSFFLCSLVFCFGKKCVK